jgi:hypothetical protein
MTVIPIDDTDVSQTVADFNLTNNSTTVSLSLFNYTLITFINIDTS